MRFHGRVRVFSEALGYERPRAVGDVDPHKFEAKEDGRPGPFFGRQGFEPVDASGAVKDAPRV
jgi:hypothetical protein